MPVPASINDLSTTAASNSPAGTESPATLDDYQRAHASFIAQLRDGVNGLVKQSSATDATAGRLLTVGAFGIGSALIPNIGNLDSFATRGGLYRWQNGVDTGTAPAGESSLVILILPYTSSVVRQVAYAINTGSDVTRTWTRQGRSGTTFSDWVMTQDAITAGAWTNMTLINGWTNNVGTTRARRIGPFTELQITLSGGVSGTEAFTLPAAFRPATDVWANLLGTNLAGTAITATYSTSNFRYTINSTNFFGGLMFFSG